MKTLVTGATGFLGTHLVVALCRTGDPKGIRVFSQSRSRALTDLGVEVMQGSVTDPGAVAAAVKGVERIYHLAGFVSRKPEDAARMYAVHVEGTRLLCDAARAARVKRMVMASTSGTIAVSERADEMPDESCPPPLGLIARWPYYASKYYQEEAARRACAQAGHASGAEAGGGDGLELVMVNPSLLLGPGDERLSSTRDVLQFLSREVPASPGGGLNFVDVRDVAAVLPAAMERGRPGERYLLGGHNMTFADFFGRLARMTKIPAPLFRAPRGKLTRYASELGAALYRSVGRTPPLVPEAVDMASHYWYFESTRARDELGFAPRDAAETLFDTVTYLREHIIGRKPLVSGGHQPRPSASTISR